VQQACCSFLLLQKPPPPPLRLPPRATASLSLLGNGCASSLRDCRGGGPPRLQGRADLVQHRECAPLTNSSVDQLFLVLVLALDFLAVAASTFSTSRVFFIFFRVSNSLLLRSKNHRKLAENTLAISFHLCIAPKTSEPERQRENSSKNSELRFNDFLLQRQKIIPFSPAFSPLNLLRRLPSSSSRPGPPSPKRKKRPPNSTVVKSPRCSLQQTNSKNIQTRKTCKKESDRHSLVEKSPLKTTKTASKQPAQRHRERERENTHTKLRLFQQTLQKKKTKQNI